MPLHLNTNVSSLRARRNLGKATSSLDKSLKRLASGFRINSAKDDAAGLQISDRMTAQINGLEQGNRNAQDGISFCQTAEGALEEMTTMYQRIRQLAVQSANGTNSNNDRQSIQQEVDQLFDEINRISEETSFGGIHLLNKSLKSPTVFQVGANAGETISLDLSEGFKINDIIIDLYNNADTEERKELQSYLTKEVVCTPNKNPPPFTVTADYLAPIGEYNVSVKSVVDITRVFKTIDKSKTFGAGNIILKIPNHSYTLPVDEGDTIESILNKHHYDIFLGSFSVQTHNVYGSPDKTTISITSGRDGEHFRPLSVTTTGDESLKFFELNVSDESKYGDVSNGWRVGNLASDTVIEIDGEEIRSAAYNGKISDRSRGLNFKVSKTCTNMKVSVKAEGHINFDVDTQSHAQGTIGIVDKFIEVIDKKRAEIGAVQNRLEHAISNQENVAQNLYDARSRIRDTDYAAETAEQTKQNILQQVSSSILVSANQSNEIILSLLKQ